MITVFFPVHNEEGNLLELHGRLNAVMEKMPEYSFEVIYIDDCSNDNSLVILNRIVAEDDRVKVIRHDRIRGQAGGFETGFRAANGDMVVVMDADLQVGPEEIPQFIEPLENGFDAVNGIRILRKASPFAILCSQVYNIAQCYLFDLRVNDVSSSYVSVKKKFVRGLRLSNNDHRYIIPILSKRGARIFESCVVHSARKHGKSKYSTSKVLTSVFEMLFFFRKLHQGLYD